MSRTPRNLPMPDPRRGPSTSREPAHPPADDAAPPPDTFLQVLLRSGLVGQVELAAILAAAPGAATATARGLADHLIEIGELTHYQTEKLLQGRWQGLVLGAYHVLAPLGRGGMGTVYLAKRTGETMPDEGQSSPDPSSPASTLVALKILPPKRAREEEKALLRFRREMELSRHLAHPNVTRTFDAGETGGVHYIAMEYVPGQSLRQLVGKGGPLPIADAARLFADVAAGLAHAHARGLIHRDLKPSNIMVTPDGRAKILDLGLALLVDEALPEDRTIVGGEGYILGTMDYIAPEQTSDATNVGPWSDIYALGCSLYYAVTGIPPFPGGTSLQKMKWHRTAAAPAADMINPGVPVGFARIIEHLMAKRPEDRPGSAEAVRALLLPWAGESPTHAAETAAPHSDREAVAEIDTRALAPTLWDTTPGGVATGTPRNERRTPDDEESESEASELAGADPRQAALITLLVVGVIVGIAALALLLTLLRRL